MAIYVWGTGCGASEMVEKGFPLEKIHAFVDSFPMGSSFLGKPVILPQDIDIPCCSLLIVTARHTDAIRQRALELGVPESRMLFLKNSHILRNLNEGSCAAELLDAQLLDRLLPRQRVVGVPPRLARSGLPEKDLQNDYVRMATLELICARIAHVPGACAELGVYRGFFARCINQLLPHRKLYLFDSFQGFAEGDGASEAFQAAHRNTAVDSVLAIMPSPEQITVKPGFFPESLEGLEEQFCLVSLDVDFEATTLEGLRYFWPRLSPGGCLMLHDWGEPKLPGVRAALEQYERELGRPIPSLPICDLGGSLILCK